MTSRSNDIRWMSFYKIKVFPHSIFTLVWFDPTVKAVRESLYFTKLNACLLPIIVIQDLNNILRKRLDLTLDILCWVIKRVRKFFRIFHLYHLNADRSIERSFVMDCKVKKWICFHRHFLLCILRWKVSLISHR